MIGRDQSVLAIVPARGGSKGLPGKNLRPLAGLPLIAHSILFGKMCPQIDRLIVSTDSPEIAAVAREFGADVPFMRPAELATDQSPMWPVLRHALDAVEKLDQRRFHFLVLLDPTSPGRLPEDVATALARLSSVEEADGIVAVSQPEFNPIWTCVVEQPGGWMADLIGDASQYGRRQDVPTVFRINATLYVWRADFVRRESRDWRRHGRHLLHEVPEARAVHVDEADQFTRLAWMVDRGLIGFPWMPASPLP